MASKVAVALLVMCVVVIASVHADKFGSCFNTCEQECMAGGQGQTFCEMKCDTDCFDKEVAGSVNEAHLAPIK
ncbi:hypothetical protein P3X46_006169 [Hevea brasiliensis]|uniref:Major pollen allergen Ole e 6-like n=1 Tax=Hevea brasiliensis TaxID=3981 RepID=A0ABQ9MRY2_HEVBR|nr:hypothetical protein P3X46_006169 [Hevea brasiliensis]